MYAIKLNTQIREQKQITLDLPPDTPSGKAEVVVLIEPDEATAAPAMSLREFSAWIKQQPPSGRSREEIDAQIAEERDSWGDD